MDIVERLRDTTGIHEDLIYEAADEIERLRDCEAYNAKSVLWANNQIERLREVLQSISNNTCCDNCQEAALVARAALKEKE